MTAKCSRAAIPLSMITLLVTAAGAALTNLPESSHYSGASYYRVNLGNGNAQIGRVEFAVYDTELNPDEFDYTAPGEGRYIYAYEIFNDASNSYGLINSPVPYFVIEQIGENAITSANNMGTIDSATGGVNATSFNLNALRTTAVFEFANGILAAGENSWFLILRSEQDWRVGTYSFDVPEDDDVPVPDDNEEDAPADDNPVPEPITILLMGLGAVSLFKRVKNQD